MATYLVTGGAGFIGSTLAETLLQKGERVRILDDFSSGRRQNVESFAGKVEIFEGSILDPELCARAMKGVDVVFHEAAIPSVARTVGIKRVVFAASSSAYGDTPTLPKIETMPTAPLSPYAIAKLTCEQLMRVFASLYGIETVSLRYFNVFGARQDPTSQYAAVIPNFITAALTGKRPDVFGDGEQTRDFCYIDNTVSANLLAAASPKKLSGQVVNIACAERISLNQLLKIIGEVVGTKIEPVYHPGRAGDVRDSLASIDAARELLGYEPKVLVKEGLAKTVAAFKTFTK